MDGYSLFKNSFVIHLYSREIYTIIIKIKHEIFSNVLSFPIEKIFVAKNNIHLWKKNSQINMIIICTNITNKRIVSMIRDIIAKMQSSYDELFVYTTRCVWEMQQELFNEVELLDVLKSNPYKTR